MVALQIREVPDDVRDALVEQARAKGQSLQAFLLDLLRIQARRPANAALLATFAGRSDGGRFLPGEIAAVIADERERHDDRR